MGALIDGGANPRLTDKEGKTALSFAELPAVRMALIDGGARL
jgi:hypothetical protein